MTSTFKGLPDSCGICGQSTLSIIRPKILGDSEEEGMQTEFPGLEKVIVW